MDSPNVPQGQISSLAGELMTSIVTSMNDTEADAFYNSVNSSIESRKDNSRRIVTKDWLDAAMANRKAIHNRLKYTHKGFNPETDIIASSWDIPEDVEAMGMNDYYKNKEKSTDVYFKIKTKDGVILDEVSLKKDKNVNLLNSGVGKFQEWDPQASDDINQKTFIQKRKEKLGSFTLKNKKKIENIINNGTGKSADALRDVLESKNLTIDNIVTPNNKDSLKGALYATYALRENGDKAAGKLADEIDKESKEFSSNCIKHLIDNPKLKEGLLKDIGKELPIHGVIEGRESIAIGDISFDSNTAKKLFGTDKWEDIKEKLVTGKDTSPYIGYQATVKSKVIPIAGIRVKEESGVGYSTSFKLTMTLHPKFAKELDTINKDIYYNKNENSAGRYEALIIGDSGILL
jgi:hypothetical protein